ncbi:MAG: endopeptidase La [Dysgonomonas sp.]|jgi:ATP-dependent Lon protease|uniref:endopeptidase La n=1 Tax=unclassified Dysgonomonas TaxID=2630389 RepID=UPI0025B8E1EF|nr:MULTISPECIES: endopeptidase La [unclassified Dysgonomonas]MDR1717630.1 endopeptidase La [Prevotella sp.]MDR2003669.1 endopeptidase La [Prevotella sp.]HMM01591.1 endopeptidase La [Dysgonomonas sp.]
MSNKKRDFLHLNESNEQVISIIANDFDDGDCYINEKDLKEELPILPLRNTVIFPGTSMPIAVARKKSLKLIKSVNRLKGKYVGLVCQKDAENDDPEIADLYSMGVIGEIIRVIELPDDENVTVIFQGKKRFRLTELTQTEPFLKGHYEIRETVAVLKNDTEYKALLDSIRDMTIQMLRMYGEPPKEFIQRLKSDVVSPLLVNYCCANLPVSGTEKQSLLDIDDDKERAYRLLVILNRETQMMEMKLNIQMKTREELNQQQKEYFLQQQIKTIQDELGGNPQQVDLDEFRQRGQKKKWNKEAAQTFEKEMSKLERLHPQSPDYSTQFTYIETLLDLPWGEYTKDNFNLKNAQKVLDQDHFGLEKVKERIIEHLAVLKLKGDLKSPIICLYGPPGVGKTSLGKSIAKALNRNYVRVSFGGLHDESEIRGHRRTYIGAMPGRIIQNILKAGSSNPVFVLDEVDKIGSDFKGDPSSALLEVLDPEQNSAFHDNYLNIDYDLSKVMFIATANNLSTISQPLLDRMELIDVSGYIIEEKVEIARRHLIPKQMENHGLAKDVIDIPKKTIEKIVENYTRESGVRELDKKIAKVMRKVARKVASEEEYKKIIEPEDLHEYLGAIEYTRDQYQGNGYAGVVTGLAWTSVGGEILFIETSLSKGKGGKLTLTGNLGDVMKESAVLALEYLHSHSQHFGIDEKVFDNWNVHVHVPEGAIPKDGPSAGITMVTSLASAFTQRRVKANLAMTGEITLRGKVLPVGGIREKILAAKRAGIKDIILCKENKKDIDEIKPLYLKGLTFHYVDDIKQVLDIALLKEKVKEPLDLTVKEEKTAN